MATIYSSGFGDSASNGTWTDDGTYDGQPRWVNGAASRWVRSSAGGTPRWYVATTNAGAGTGSIYYDNNDIATDPFPYSVGVSWVDNGGGTPLGSFSTTPFTSIKTVNGLAYASVKTVNDLAVASVKTINGLA